MHEANPSSLHVNYRYLLDFIEKEAVNTLQYRILDYSCGSAEIVETGRARGFQIFGAEKFYSTAVREIVSRKDLLGDLVREIENGKIAFADEYFDLVVSNQVFEHVEDLGVVVNEIDRILKPGGKLITLFPSAEVWRECHCGIPFLHWFSKTSRIRYWYALALRSLGLGKLKGNRPYRKWVKYWLGALDQNSFYRSGNETSGPLQTISRADISKMTTSFIGLDIPVSLR